VLHSGHFSRPFQRLISTTCSLKWRENGAHERLWNLRPRHPILEGIHLPHGELHTQLMLQSMTRDCMAVFTMQGEDLPQASNRIDLDPSVRDVYGLPAGRVTYGPHRHEVVCAEHWAPRLEAVMRDAGATATFWTTSPPLPA